MNGEYNVSYGYKAAAQTFLKTFLYRTATRLNHRSRRVQIPGTILYVPGVNSRKRCTFHVVSVSIPTQCAWTFAILRYLFRSRMAVFKLRKGFSNILRKRVKASHFITDGLQPR